MTNQVLCYEVEPTFAPTISGDLNQQIDFA